MRIGLSSRRVSRYVGTIIVSALLAIAPVGTAFAHQSGCHRWHSCSSDSGAYVCGDLGYACSYPTYSYNPRPVVYSTYRAPILGAIPTQYGQDWWIRATWSDVATATATDWIGLYASPSAPDAAYLRGWYTTGYSSDAEWLLAPPSSYGNTFELRLFSSGRYVRLATSRSFSLGTNATLFGSYDRATGLITASWNGVTRPSSGDWIALYASPQAPDSAYLTGAYTGGTSAGAGRFGYSGEPGMYELRLISADGRRLAATTVVVTA